MGRKRFCTLINKGKAKGDAALSLVDHIHTPCENGVLLGKVSVHECASARLCEKCLNILPRGPRDVFVGGAIQRSLCSVVNKTGRGGSSRCATGVEGTRTVRKVMDLAELRKLLSHRPCSLDNKRRRHLTLTGILLLRPELLLVSRPAGKLSTRCGRRLKSVLGGLGTRKVAVFVVSRSIRFITRCTSEINLFFRKGIIAYGDTESFFTKGDFCAATTGHVTERCFPSTIAKGRITTYLGTEL